MSQNIGDLFEASAVVEHLGCGGMPEEMTPSARARSKTDTLERPPHYPPDRAASQRMKRGTTLEKDLAVVTLRPTSLYVGHQRLADFLCER
jgi:hypothetical protein